ncbi:MAG: hypothetical protein ABJA67_16215 [Chthonomonadales bacterium]
MGKCFLACALAQKACREVIQNENRQVGAQIRGGSPVVCVVGAAGIQMSGHLVGVDEDARVQKFSGGSRLP